MHDRTWRERERERPSYYWKSRCVLSEFVFPFFFPFVIRSDFFFCRVAPTYNAFKIIPIYIFGCCLCFAFFVAENIPNTNIYKYIHELEYNDHHPRRRRRHHHHHRVDMKACEYRLIDLCQCTICLKYISIYGLCACECVYLHEPSTIPIDDQPNDWPTDYFIFPLLLLLLWFGECDQTTIRM